MPVLHVIGVRRMGDFGGASCSIARPVLHVVGESTMAAVLVDGSGADLLVTVFADCVLVDASSVARFGLSTDFYVFAVLAATTTRLEVLAFGAAVFPDLVLTIVEVVRWKFVFASLAAIALLAFGVAVFPDLVLTMVEVVRRSCVVGD